MEHVIRATNGRGVLTHCTTMFYGAGWQNAMPINMEHVTRTMNGHGVLTRCATMFYCTGWQNAMPVPSNVSSHDASV
jgi:hypothetical protein